MALTAARDWSVQQRACGTHDVPSVRGAPGSCGVGRVRRLRPSPGLATGVQVAAVSRCAQSVAAAGRFGHVPGSSGVALFRANARRCATPNAARHGTHAAVTRENQIVRGSYTAAGARVATLTAVAATSGALAWTAEACQSLSVRARAPPWLS